MATVIWSGPAVRQVERIVEVIAEDSPAVAAKWVRRIMAAPDILATMPLIGPMVDEIGRPEIRELLVKPYRIIYRVRGDVCTIGAVYHGRQDLLSHLDPDDLP
jgi:toxin ParE1/3/4